MTSKEALNELLYYYATSDERDFGRIVYDYADKIEEDLDKLDQLEDIEEEIRKIQAEPKQKAR